LLIALSGKSPRGLPDSSVPEVFHAKGRPRHSMLIDRKSAKNSDRPAPKVGAMATQVLASSVH
jgi:hypothetical protein